MEALKHPSRDVRWGRTRAHWILHAAWRGGEFASSRGETFPRLPPLPSFFPDLSSRASSHKRATLNRGRTEGDGGGGWTEEQDVRGGRRRRAAATFATRRPGLAVPRPLVRPCQPAQPRYRVSESCSERASSAGGRVGEVNASVRGRARLPVPSPYPAAQP